MEHKNKLEALNQQSLEKIEEFVKSKSNLKEEDHIKLTEAKHKWQSSWTEFMDILMYLENLEI